VVEGGVLGVQDFRPQLLLMGARIHDPGDPDPVLPHVG
jgi:hypothetical protein